MKINRIIIKSFIIAIALTFISFVFIIKADDEKISVVAEATYKATSNVMTQTLDGGITHYKDLGLSTGENISNSDETKRREGTQVVNVLNIPSTTDLRVVTWRASERTSWKLSTVVNMAKDYEANHPGWVVLAGVNGDFFDIQAKQPFPYQTTGVLYTDGEMYRAQNSFTLGVKNDGSTTPLVGEKNFQTTPHQLQIYNEADEIIATYNVTNYNEAPTEGGLSVYFTYTIFNSEDKREKVVATIPAENSYTVTDGTMLVSTSTEMYGKGIVTSINTSLEYNKYEFGLVTNNEEIKAKLALGTKVRVQKNVIGDYAECDNIFGCREQLLVNGAPTSAVDNYRHPRTCIGAKADGTIVLFTVDGRQPVTEMYGMNYSELQATLLYYGCNEAYNLDGGGSTTMIIRDAEGNFDVMNSPSDGSERNDANAIFVVAPRLALNVDQVTDTQIDVSYSEPAKGVNIDNIVFSINDQDLPMNENKLTYNNLLPNTEYAFTTSYDVTYKNHTSKVTSATRYITTGSQKPVISKFTYEEKNDEYIFRYLIDDPKDTISIMMIKSGRKLNFIDDLSSNTYIVDKSRIDLSITELVVEYNVASSTKQANSDSYIPIPYVPLTSNIDLSMTALLKYDLEANQEVTWQSSDETILKFENNQAVPLKGGNVEVTVTNGFEEKKYNVTIVKLPDISVNIKDQLFVNEELTLESNQDVTYTISDESIAKIENGKLIALKAGKVTIQVKTIVETKEYTITVTEPVPDIEPEPVKKGCKKKDISIYLYLMIALTSMVFIFRRKK